MARYSRKYESEYLVYLIDRICDLSIRAKQSPQVSSFIIKLNMSGPYVSEKMHAFARLVRYALANDAEFFDGRVAIHGYTIVVYPDSYVKKDTFKTLAHPVTLSEACSLSKIVHGETSVDTDPTQVFSVKDMQAGPSEDDLVIVEEDGMPISNTEAFCEVTAKVKECCNRMAEVHENFSKYQESLTSNTPPKKRSKLKTFLLGDITEDEYDDYDD